MPSTRPCSCSCFEPLTLFTPATAFWIWTSFNLVVLAIGIYLLLIRRPGLDANTAWLLGALILAFYPVGWNFFWAQTQVLVLVLMVSAMRAMEDEHDDAAGLFVALAGLLRAYPFLLLGYFALRRNWRALKFAIAGAFVGALFPVLILGFARCFSFVHGAAWMSNHDRVDFPIRISVAPFVSRMYWALLGPTACRLGPSRRHLCRRRDLPGHDGPRDARLSRRAATTTSASTRCGSSRRSCCRQSHGITTSCCWCCPSCRWQWPSLNDRARPP